MDGVEELGNASGLADELHIAFPDEGIAVIVDLRLYADEWIHDAPFPVTVPIVGLLGGLVVVQCSGQTNIPGRNHERFRL